MRQLLNTTWKTSMPYNYCVVVAFCVLVAACGERNERSLATSAEPPYQSITNIHQTMAWILDPAAEVIWDSAGTIITAQGHQELAPTTDAGWAEVLHAAAILTEAGNLLMMPGRAAGDDWIEYAQGLTAAGQLAIKAAQDQDDEALFEAGGRIYQVCRACHNQYWIEDEGGDQRDDGHDENENDQGHLTR
jgi:hypothetical protein